MKKTMLFAACMLLLTCILPAQEKIKTNAEQVTFYIDGAQVTRTKSINLAAGETTLLFTGMSPYMDAKSMQVKAQGKFTVLGVNHQFNYTDSLERNALTMKMETLSKKSYELQASKEVVQAQIDLLKANCSVGNRTSATTLATIKELNSYYATESMALRKKIISIDEQLRTIGNEITDIQAELTQLGQKSTKANSEIEVKVSANAACQAYFTITYFVKNAGWFPSYDIRSEGLGKPLTLSYKANIFQNTQEDWKDVKLSLSSSSPSIGNVLPELRTYWLDYGLAPPRYDNNMIGNTVQGTVTDNKREPLIGVSVLVPGTTIGAITDANGHYSITLPEGKRSLQFAAVGYTTQTREAYSNTLNISMKEDRASNENVVIAYGAAPKAMMRSAAVKATSDMAIEEEIALPESDVMEAEQTQNMYGYEFEIVKKLSIPSDGKAVVSEIGRYELPASYQYRCVPKISKDAFVVAEAIGWKKHNLLEGEANVYFENSFVGKTVLNPYQTGDTLSLSMGKNNAIRIQRTKINESTSRKLIASNQVQTMTWLITIENTQNQSVTIQVQDQLPVSRDNSIEVTAEELSGGKLNDKGIVTWVINLQPNEKRELLLQYKVKSPKSNRLIVE
ncbi:MAG: mucoidy inhibitor MuiA family protein [Bacteroides sp.]|nr:mucoidy inhibitor MuiA family protein [Bacteroides sp.]